VKRLRRPALAAAVLAAALLAAPAPLAAQCAMCKAALTSSEEGRQLSATLNRAILVMLAAPYLVVGGFVAVAFRRRIGERLGRWAARLRP
jgi:hypothetical protein